MTWFRNDLETVIDGLPQAVLAQCSDVRPAVIRDAYVDSVRIGAPVQPTLCCRGHVGELVGLIVNSASLDAMFEVVYVVLILGVGVIVVWQYKCVALPVCAWWHFWQQVS